jgi:hypothetical protein
MVVSFLLDEVALIVFPAIFLMFPRLVLRSRASMAMFAMIPVVYVGTVVWAMPALTRFAGYPNPGGYCAETDMTAMLSLKLSLRQYGIVLDNIVGNAQSVLTDCFGLVPPDLAESGYYTCLYCGIVGMGTAYVLMLLIGFWKQRSMDVSTLWTLLQTDRPWARAARVALALVVALVYEGMLMSVSPGRIEPRVWGLYYYGVFCTIFLALALGLVWQALNASRAMAGIFALLVVCATTFVFPATNQAYKDLHYYPYAPYRLAKVFANQENRFDFKRSDSIQLWREARALWRASETHRLLRNVPSEMVYALYELGLTSPPKPNRSPYFDLTWQDGVPTCESHD